MKVVSLVKQDRTDSLLLFFAGWASDERPFMGLTASSFDVLMLYDYRSLDDSITLLDSLLQDYTTIYICAWSMGVWAASECVERLKHHSVKIATATAVNGTLEPISACYGIKPEVFSATVDNLPEGLPRFDLRMCGSKRALDSYNTARPQRSSEEVKSELIAISQRVRRLESVKWSRAVVASNDLIITTQNQLSFWRDYRSNMDARVGICEVEGAHFIFNNYHSWEQIIDE